MIKLFILIIKTVKECFIDANIKIYIKDSDEEHSLRREFPP